MKKFTITSILSLCTLFISAQVSDTNYVQVEGTKLYTVLTKPEQKNISPIAIIIAGSGPTDLNGNQAQLGINNNSLKFLSDALVSNHIATLRYDKRAIANSAVKNFNEADLTIDHYAEDVISLVKYCKDRGYSKIYLIGHSEGSLIALIAAQKIKISGFVSLAGAGNPADILLKNQLQPKLPPAFYAQVESIIDSLKNKHTVVNVPPQLNALFRKSVQPYLISWFAYNPAKLIANLKCPTLIIQGDNDIQVDVKEAEILKEASKKSELIIINNMNHILKTISGDNTENVSSYSNPNLPIHKDLEKSITQFINH